MELQDTNSIIHFGSNFNIKPMTIKGILKFAFSGGLNLENLIYLSKIWLFSNFFRFKQL